LNVRTKINDALSETRRIEGGYIDRVKSGSTEMEDYLELRYLSGVRNALAFMIHIMASPLSEEEFDKLLRNVLHQDKETVN